MLATDRLSCFWPGLAQAWWRGSSRGLAAALLFGWALCVLLLATFVWPNWFRPWLVTLCWLGMLCFWTFESIRSHWQLGNLQRDAGPVAGDDRFAQAQQEYLRGHWFEAESLLHAILTDTPRDPEAHLLLAGVLRRSGRLSAALRRLDQLVLLDTSLRWGFEIRRERQLIAARQQELQDQKASPEENSQAKVGQAKVGQEKVGPGAEQAVAPSVVSSDEAAVVAEPADLPEESQSPNNASDRSLAA